MSRVIISGLDDSPAVWEALQAAFAHFVRIGQPSWASAVTFTCVCRNGAEVEVEVHQTKRGVSMRVCQPHLVRSEA